MREYRGKRIDNGEWVYGYYWCNEEAGDFHKGRHFIRSMNFQPAEFDYTDYEVLPESVGQRTGLKNKQGTDLNWWEGDLFSIDQILYQIIFDKGSFWFECTSRKHRFFCAEGVSWIDPKEKIGNTTDSPKLLEGDSK